MSNYNNKYLKYKKKYLDLNGGSQTTNYDMLISDKTKQIILNCLNSPAKSRKIITS